MIKYVTTLCSRETGLFYKLLNMHVYKQINESLSKSKNVAV
jgi:hypothetical protein